jgi:hypothetical protein
MFSTVLRLDCALTTFMKIFLRCRRAACTITALLLRSFYDFTPILVGHDPNYACFEHVQNKRDEGVELPDHEDITTIIRYCAFMKTPLRFSRDLSRSATFSGTLDRSRNRCVNVGNKTSIFKQPIDSYSGLKMSQVI